MNIKKLIEENKDTVKKIIKYLMTGTTAFIIEFLLFILFKQVFEIHYVVANIIVYTLMFWFTFLVNKYFTFRAKGGMGGQLLRYILLYAFNLTVTNCLLYLLGSVIGINEYLAKIIVSGSVVLWNFPIYKKFIYK